MEEDSNLTAHGTILGTPGYMAPEQERGEVDRIDERTDVWALGAILGFPARGRGRSPVRSRRSAAGPCRRPGGPLSHESTISPRTSPATSRAQPSARTGRACSTAAGRFARRHRMAILLRPRLCPDAGAAHRHPGPLKESPGNVE